MVAVFAPGETVGAGSRNIRAGPHAGCGFRRGTALRNLLAGLKLKCAKRALTSPPRMHLPSDDSFAPGRHQPGGPIMFSHHTRRVRLGVQALEGRDVPAATVL